MTISEALEIKDNQIAKLKGERNEEIYDTLYEIERKYDKKILLLKEEKEKIRNLVYLNYKDSIDAIVYLVNKIEKDKYEKVVIPIKYVKEYRKKVGPSYNKEDYFVIGLTCNKENVEIKKDCMYSKEDFDFQLYAFVKLAIVSKQFDSYSHIKPFENKQKINYLSDEMNESFVWAYSDFKVNTYISDTRFKYIQDYIKKVIEYRLEKENYEITLDEMKKIADEFACKYTKTKKLVKDVK